MGQGDEKTYEMLWDCEYCGTKKLLGKTHRHCPECGAAQDADRRYFPEDDEKVAVEDHQFVGADKYCPSCNTPNSAVSKFCSNCGGPMEEGEAVRGVVDEPPPKAPTPPEKANRTLRIALVLIGLAILGGVLAVFLWKQQVPLVVTGHSWQCVVSIERYGPVTQTAWCDRMPVKARNVHRSRAVRSHKKVRDGETCTTKRIDNKDGTFKEKRVCSPKYREEPIYDDQCRFTIDTWSRSREARTAGQSLAQPVTWPVVNLPPNPVARLGAERIGGRNATFTVRFQGPENKAYTCDFPEAKWRAFGINTTWKGESSVVSDSLSCDKLISGSK